MIPYLGNKSTLSDFLKQYIPKNPKKWIEPFGGGFNLFFTLDLRDYPDTEFIYNDINPLNCYLFEHLKTDEFIEIVEKTNITKELFEKSYLDIIDDSSNKRSKKTIKVSNTQSKALSWLIILCCGESRDLMSKDFRGNANFEILKYKLSRYTEYFKRIEITNLDYKDVLKKYDSEESFFYLDPPYYGFEKYYVNHNFQQESHSELSEQLKSIKGNWLLSYYKFDHLEDWYSGHKIVSKKHNLNEEFLIIK